MFKSEVMLSVFYMLYGKVCVRVKYRQLLIMKDAITSDLLMLRIDCSIHRFNAVSSFIYGLDVLNLRKNNTDQLEAFQKNCMKQL